MTEELIKYQCPECLGPLHFDAETQMIVCDYCDSKYPENYFETEQEPQTEEVDWATEGVVRQNEVLEEQSGFICTSCGAEVVSDRNTVATECMYCSNPVVISNNISGVVKPDVILPFKISKEQAEQMLKDFYKGKVLLPNTFTDENRIKKIAGMYVPFWLYSGKGDGNATYDGQEIEKYTSGDYEITKTKHYDIYRSGNLKFSKIPVDASRKMEDEYMDGLEPFEYHDLKKFSPQYMAGFFADKFDVDVNECRERAKVRAINSTGSAFMRTITGFDRVSLKNADINFIEDDTHYALFPVWMLNTKYHGKIYTFAINGQTGKVSGELPIDKMKKFLLELKYFAGITAILTALFAFMFFGGA